jgi:hypothetical protein
MENTTLGTLLYVEAKFHLHFFVYVVYENSLHVKADDLKYWTHFRGKKSFFCSIGSIANSAAHPLLRLSQLPKLGKVFDKWDID